MKRQVIEAARIAAKTAFALAEVPLGDIQGPRILIYHQIGGGTGRQMEVTVDAFRSQLNWLADNAEVVDLESAIARRKDPDAQRLVALTFDDGYDDMFRLGFPMLADRRLPFTLYLTTRPTETGEPLAEGAAAITWDQVKEMLDSGLMTLGAHTHAHRDMRLLDPQTIADDLDTSNDLIEQRTGIVPRHFTYPWGYWSDSADAAVRARYTTATLGSGRPADHDDLWVLNRIPVQLSDGAFHFKRKMRGGLRLEDRLRRRLRGYDGP